MHRRLHSRQHILGPVLGLSGEQRNLFLGALALGNVSRDF
jgi:hypothetical protein